ncbi:MAG: sigma-54-dependent Fis family transcriptional regulator [Planctomycetes bacterium]|nr:sigma-54-dependent Fis family transcriptional regulator [Planctomycetota bacterium]
MNTKAPIVVIVDDEPGILEVQKATLESLGIQPLCFNDPLKAWERIRQGPVDLVITDWEMPEMTGLNLLFKIRGLQNPPQVIFLSGFGNVSRAVQALVEGATDFIEKPFEPGAYQKAVRDALERSHSGESHISGGKNKAVADRAPETVIASAAMKRIFETARAAAASDAAVLLLGESGTGKEVVADFIHRQSRRAKGPSIKVNCGALPESLIESELFGHEKGAFTGADRRRIGRFELANGGTLFLDEIGELPAAMQVKLLRALQEKTIERVGGEGPVASDFRLVSATNKNLQEEVAEENFREDLFYRINVVPIRIPPLRQRVEDLPPLAAYFLEILAKASKAPLKELHPAALEALKRFHWPGNVRQLRNAIEYAVVMSRDRVIELKDLPEDVLHFQGTAAPAGGGAAEAGSAAQTVAPRVVVPEGGLDALLQSVEKDAIETSLIRHDWEIQTVLDELKISRSRLYDRMKAYGIKRP